MPDGITTHGCPRDRSDLRRHRQRERVLRPPLPRRGLQRRHQGAHRRLARRRGCQPGRGRAEGAVRGRSGSRAGTTAGSASANPSRPASRASARHLHRAARRSCLRSATVGAAQHEFVAGSPLPVWVILGDPTSRPSSSSCRPTTGREDDDLLDGTGAVHYDGLPGPPPLQDETWADIVSDALFGTDHPPRYVILVGFNDWLLLDRYKWPNNRAAALRLDRNPRPQGHLDPAGRGGAAASRQPAAPDEAPASSTALDENAHKHAFGVSEDLKYALREAIELLGNEAVQQLRQKAAGRQEGFLLRQGAVDAGEPQPSNACGWCTGCCSCSTSRRGRSLATCPFRKRDHTLRATASNRCAIWSSRSSTPHLPAMACISMPRCAGCFRSLAQGCGASAQQSLSAGSVKEAFTLAPLDSKLFDPAATPCSIRCVPQPCLAACHPSHVVVRRQAQRARQLPVAVDQPARRRIRGAALLPGLLRAGRPVRSAA